MNIEYCPLCNSKGVLFYREVFFLCSNCSGIFKSKSSLPNPDEERKRYEEHENDISDTRYQNFVSPITNAVLSHYSADSLGLDFGAGTGPVISAVLEGKGYSVRQYDPIFINDTKKLNLEYDYIVCCEVIEHFHTPAKDFALLKKMLKPGGHLFCMTHLYEKDIDFDKWYYKNDNTHVFFYQIETLEKIKVMFEFSSLSIENRLITYRN